jgi:hypothetical protein
MRIRLQMVRLFREAEAGERPVTEAAQLALVLARIGRQLALERLEDAEAEV